MDHKAIISKLSRLNARAVNKGMQRVEFRINGISKNIRYYTDVKALVHSENDQVDIGWEDSQGAYAGATVDTDGNVVAVTGNDSHISYDLFGV